MIKDLKKLSVVNPDVDQSLNEIIQEVEADNSCATQNPTTTFQSEMNTMMRERAGVRVPDNVQDTQIADLTTKLQEQILQQQLLQEQITQQRLTSESNVVKRVFENMYTSFVSDSRFMLFVLVVYILFEKFNVISILKIDKMNIINSSTTNQLIVKSILFAVTIVLLKKYV
jgi:hypothetical protein